jgi:hypothetical protein
VALAAPERVLSLTSIMSSSGARGLPRPRPEVLRVLAQPPGQQPREGRSWTHYVRLFKVIGSPAFR